MQSVLITGGSGFLASHLIRRCINEKMITHVLIRPNTDLWRLQSLSSHIIIHTVDLEDFPTLQKAIMQISPSVIFHLAAHGVSSAHQDYREILMSNVVGTFNLHEALQEIPYEYFLHIGGSSEYGKKDLPMYETDFLQPTTFYGLTKACGSLLSQQFAFEYAKPLSILRPFSIYGPYESPQRLIPKAIEATLTGKALSLTRPGFARDYIFVEDVVNACWLCWKRKILNEIINIGSGIQTTNEEIVAHIENITGKKIALSIGEYPNRLSDKSHWVADISKAKKLLEWEPYFSLEQGLKKTYDQALS